MPDSLWLCGVCSHCWGSCSTKRKALLQTLRYIALCHGASFMCVSQKDKTQLNHVRAACLLCLRFGLDAMPALLLRQFRGVLNHFVFRTELKRSSQLNPSKPLLIPPGMPAAHA